MIYTLLAVLASFVGMVCGIGALIAVRRSTATMLLRRLADLSEAQESLNLQMRSVKVRLSAITRARKNGKFAESDDQAGEDDKQRESPAEWKRKTNLALAMRGMK